MLKIEEILEKIRSPHADLVYVAAGYTKADMICDIEAWWQHHQDFVDADVDLKF